MNKSTTERLAEYMAFRSVNNNMITVAAGLSVGQIGKAISNNAGINSASIEKILHTYPELNPEWLLTGIGDMLKDKGKKEAPLDDILVELAQLRKENVMQSKIIAVLERENELLREKVQEKSAPKPIAHPT